MSQRKVQQQKSKHAQEGLGHVPVSSCRLFYQIHAFVCRIVEFIDSNFH